MWFLAPYAFEKDNRKFLKRGLSVTLYLTHNLIHTCHLCLGCELCTEDVRFTMSWAFMEQSHTRDTGLRLWLLALMKTNFWHSRTKATKPTCNRNMNSNTWYKSLLHSFFLCLFLLLSLGRNFHCKSQSISYDLLMIFHLKYGMISGSFYIIWKYKS